MRDVVVVGAGMAGAATTWALARRGRSVLLVDRFARGHDRGSSHGAERIFRFGYTDPAYVTLAQQSWAG
jgi:sarcosine oxidase